MYRLRYTAIVLLFLAVSLHAGDKKKQQLIYLKPDQTADLQPAKMVTAKQKCENWALAAGLETLFQREGVSLSQNFWVMRLNRAEVCTRNSRIWILLPKQATKMLYCPMASTCGWKWPWSPARPPTWTR